MGGTIANPALFPILVKAATVTATTTGTNLADSGNIVISDNVPASFTAVTSGNATGFIVLTTTNDAALTIGGATSTGGGSITLNSAGGIVLNATLGNAPPAPSPSMAHSPAAAASSWARRTHARPEHELDLCRRHQRLGY